MTFEGQVREAENESFVRYIATGNPPFIGQPLAVVLMSRGDSIGELVMIEIEQGRINIVDSPTAERALLAITAAFRAPDRIRQKKDLVPNRSLSVIDLIIKRATNEDGRRFAEGIRRDITSQRP